MMELPKDVGSDMLDMKLNERTPARTRQRFGTPPLQAENQLGEIQGNFPLNHDYGRKGVHSRKLKAGMPNIGGLVQMIFP